MTITLHVDASRGEFCSGIGYVMTGSVEHEGCKTLEETMTSMEAEYYALVEGLRLAAMLSEDCEGIDAYVDVKPLVTKMRRPDGKSEVWRTRRRGCHWLLNKFDSWELSWQPRSKNGKAHDLAQTALDDGRSWKS